MQAQLNRIYSYPTVTMSRINAAYEIYRRYRNTIQSNLGYSNSGTGIGVMNIANMRFNNPNYQTIGEINAARVPVSSYTRGVRGASGTRG